MKKEFGFSDVSFEVAKRANFKCEYCGLNILESVYTYELFQIDHIMPVSHGGSDTIDNYALACKLCNRIKRNYIYKSNYSNRDETIHDIGNEIKNEVRKLKEKFARMLKMINEDTND